LVIEYIGTLFGNLELSVLPDTNLPIQEFKSTQNASKILLWKVLRLRGTDDNVNLIIP